MSISNDHTLVIGGCRSGKSRYALALAERYTGRSRIFLATSVPQDAEMEERVRRHRLERGGGWETVEVPLRLPEAVLESSGRAGVLLVDCITLWISNLLFEKLPEDEIASRVEKLIESVQDSRCPVILVTNEVGGGVVPENALARQFRDVVGGANQRIAAASDRVVWVAAGIPVPIKGEERGERGKRDR
ncbi:MAG: bifunctional adenosylcobinamide kinase/adenosylcobinamide-phosphate guanylyltransferase [Desulfobacteraceae bacterium]|nr:MAG: bifunctional adenosylcobinamide kinase/adenosylcobinamide-phosphate guanylyltransferase [Desulfobacteraceae bacterium]